MRAPSQDDVSTRCRYVPALASATTATSKEGTTTVTRPIDPPSPTSGPLSFAHWYFFAEGGPVESARLPFSADAPAPFEIARWSVEPGTANDRDVHISREIWLVIAGEGEVTWADQSVPIKAGEAIGFDTNVPHQVRTVGAEPLRVFSVYWKHQAS